MLDAAGFPDTTIVLSNQLDELVIMQIIAQIQDEAAHNGFDADAVINRLVYGAGTNLITSAGDPALDGVYKLVAVRQADRWIPAIKISESPAKTLNPGHKLVWRIYDRRGKATADLLSLDDEDPRDMTDLVLHHPSDHARYRTLQRSDVQEIEPLLIDVLKDGQLVCDLPTIEAMRANRRADMNRLDAGVRRLLNPHIYHVSLTQRLWELKQRLIESAQRLDAGIRGSKPTYARVRSRLRSSANRRSS